LARVLISPLGVGPTEKNIKKREYSRAIYKFDEDDKEYKTPFVAAALAQKLKVDKIYFIGTCKSMWEEVYKYFSVEAGTYFDEDYWLEIAEVVDSSSYKSCDYEKYQKLLERTNASIDSYLKTFSKPTSGGSSIFITKYGLNTIELYDNFDIFMELEDQLNEGDEIYLDIIHSFRSIPLFMYLMMDFIQTLSMKKIELKGIFYGMLDIIKEIGYAPVIDLAPLFNISNWIRGTYNFVNFGNGYLVSNLIENDELSKVIRNISELVNINYLVDLRNQINKLDRMVEKENIENIGIFRYMLPYVKGFTSRFNNLNKIYEFQLEISKWFYENKRYGHAYICLLESILTALCEIYRLSVSDYDNREQMKNILRCNNRCLHELKRLWHVYSTVNKIRNRIAHAAFYDLNFSFYNDINQFLRYYEEIKKILSSDVIANLPDYISVQEISS